MASFSDKLKDATASVSSTFRMAEPAVMTLSLEDESIAAYSDDEWIKPDNANLYDYYTEYHDESYSTVDENKNIVLSNSQINLTQEKNSQYIPFKINRYYDGFDLSTTKLSFYWVNELGAGSTAFPVDVYYNSESIKFAWLVDDDVTAIKGNIEFEIHAEGTNSLGRDYLWKTKSNKGLNVIQALQIQKFIEPDETWQESFVEKLSVQADRAESAANRAESAASTVENLVVDLQNGLTDEVNTIIGENYYTKEEVDEAISGVDVSSQLADYAKSSDVYTKSEVDEAIAGVDVSSQLNDYATKTYVQEQIDAIPETDLSDYALKTEIPVVPGNVSAFTNDAGYLTEHQDISGKSDIGHTHTLSEITDYKDPDLSGYALKEEIPSVEGLASETYVQEEIAKIDVTDQLANYYTKDETYNKNEIDTAIDNVEVDLTGYATESYVGEQVSPINTAITSINQTLEGIDKSPRVTYRATYGDVELDDGSTAKNMFSLLKTENGEESVQDRFQILGGGGTGSGVVMKIAYVDGYGTPLVATADDKVILKYDFSGEDTAGDTNLDGVASWKVGSRVVKTEDVSTGVNEFDLTDYVSVGDNKVLLTITHATGSIATKAWTIKIVDVRLVNNFDDTRKYVANTDVNYTFTPYGGIEKTVHFILDGEEIGTKVSLAAASGLLDSYTIPAHGHGTHLLETYITATVNNTEIKTDSNFSDIIWYDESSNAPVIGCVKQKFTARQYKTTNIEYTVYDPSTDHPVVTRKATYVNEEGETVESYNSTVTLESNTDIWSFKTDVVGEHTLTITCGETVKTLKATITELGIEVSPTTAGLEFDFNPVGYSNNDANRIWTDNNTGVSMTLSDNFDWVNGGYQIDESGDQYFCVKEGTTATVNYNLFADDAKENGKEFKVIFKTTNVKNRNTSFISCMDYGIGLDMKIESANIYSSNGSLYSPYCEDDIIEFEFNINKNTEIPMVMTYEDGVGNRPMIYTSDSSYWQTNLTPIVIGSN